MLVLERMVSFQIGTHYFECLNTDPQERASAGAATGKRAGNDGLSVVKVSMISQYLLDAESIACSSRLSCE